MTQQEVWQIATQNLAQNTFQPRVHSFSQKFEFSLGSQQLLDVAILKNCISDCVSVIKTEEVLDRSGIDYVAHLSGGALINIDAKTREPGASKYWRYNEPELALETWSVVPDRTHSGKCGWTLNTASQVDYILYTYDRADTDKFYLLPFQFLRTVFARNEEAWSKKYMRKRQESKEYKGWYSEAIFVPASIVISKINEVMTGNIYQTLT